MGRVYILTTGDERYVKIGFTARPLVLRLSEIQCTGFAYEHGGIAVLGFFPASIEVETSIHRMFDEFRFHGDWYEATPVLERFCRVVVPISENPRILMPSADFQSNGGMASAGGMARAAMLSPERRKEIASMGGKAGGRGRKKKAPVKKAAA
jgi:hypothetical protein